MPETLKRKERMNAHSPNGREERKIGVAVIGLGKLGHYVAGEYGKLPLVGSVVGCDVDEQRRKAAKEDLGIMVEEDWRKTVAREDVDLAHVAVPNDLHADVACAAMDAGKHVLLEKPMAHSLDACRTIMETQKRTNAFLQIGFECRYSLLYKRAKEIVASGRIGRVCNFHMDYFQSMWPAWLEHPGGWKWLRERSGGMVGEKLCHYIDLFQWYTDDRVEEVDVFAAPPVLSHFSISDSLHLGMRATEGAVGMITFSFCRASTSPEDQTPGLDGAGRGARTEQTLIGEKGSLCLNEDNLLEVFLYERDGRSAPYLAAREDYRDRRHADLVHNINAEVKDVAARVASGLPPALSPQEAFQVFEVCFAAEESIRRQAAVRLRGDTGEPCLRGT